MTIRRLKEWMLRCDSSEQFCDRTIVGKAEDVQGAVAAVQRYGWRGKLRHTNDGPVYYVYCPEHAEEAR